MAGTAAVVGLGATASSAYEQVKSAREQRDAAGQAAEDRADQAKLEQQRADIKAAQDARASIRAARAASGAIINSAANAGAVTSSGAAGGVASVGSQLGYNLGFISQTRGIDTGELALSADIADQGARSARAAASAEEWGVYGSIGSSIFAGAGGYKKLFGGV